MGNATRFLGTGECSSKISGHKFRERSIYMVVDFLQEHLSSGEEMEKRWIVEFNQSWSVIKLKRRTRVHCNYNDHSWNPDWER